MVDIIRIKFWFNKCASNFWMVSMVHSFTNSFIRHNTGDKQRMITLDFLILTILFILNLVLLIIKEKSVVYISFIIAIFTWFISGWYLIEVLDIVNTPIGIEGFYCLLVIIVSVLMFFEKGSEKW